MKKYIGAAALAIAAVTSVSGRAGAFHEARTRSWGDTFGGSDAGGTLRYVSSQDTFGAQAGNGTKRMYGQAQQSFEASARIVGKKWTALALDTRGAGSWMQLPGGSGTLTKSALADYTIFNSETNATPFSCSNDNYTCASASPYSTSGTLAEVDRTVVIGFVPVNLVGQLGYSLTTSLDAKASAMKYLGIQNSLFSRTSASASASAALSGHFEICSPDCDFGFGGAADLTIVRASITPTATSSIGSVWSATNDAKFGGTNQGPLTVRVLDGKFSLKIDLAFDDWTWDIYKWTGYKWTKTLWSDDLMNTCVDWLANPGSCKDIANN